MKHTVLFTAERIAQQVADLASVIDVANVDSYVVITVLKGAASKTVTCTAETSAGQSIESTGENLGEDDATLVVTVDGQVIYNGLLTGVPGS